MIKDSGGGFGYYSMLSKIWKKKFVLGLWINWKRFLSTQSINWERFFLQYKTWVTINSTKQKSYKKQKKNALKKSLLSIT